MTMNALSSIFSCAFLLGMVLQSCSAAVTVHLTIDDDGEAVRMPLTSLKMEPTRFSLRQSALLQRSPRFEADYGNIKLEGIVDFAVSGGIGNIKSWVKEAYDGNDCRKDITINIMKADTGEDIRQFNLIETCPVHFEILDIDTANPDVLHWTLSVRVNRWESARRRLEERSLVIGDEEGLFWLTIDNDPMPVKFTSGVGFGAELGDDGRLGRGQGADVGQTKGIAEWEDITLVGALNSERTQMLTWFNAMTQGRSSEAVKDIKVQVVNPSDATKPILQSEFTECFLSSYSLTPLNSSDGSIELIETVEIKVGFNSDFS